MHQRALNQIGGTLRTKSGKTTRLLRHYDYAAAPWAIPEIILEGKLWFRPEVPLLQSACLSINYALLTPENPESYCATRTPRREGHDGRSA